MKKIFAIILVSFALFSCRAPKCAEGGTVVHTIDTVIIKDTTVVVQNVPVQIKGDSSRIVDSIKELPKDFKKEKEVKSGHTTAKYKIENQQLTVECNTEPYEDTIKDLRVKLQTAERIKSKETTNTKILTKEVKTPVTPTWAWVLLAINVTAVGVYLYTKGILGGVFRFIKKLF